MDEGETFQEAILRSYQFGVFVIGCMNTLDYLGVRMTTQAWNEYYSRLPEAWKDSANISYNDGKEAARNA